MATQLTSGNTAFNLDLTEIVEEAFERVGSEMRTGYDLRTARRSLNLLFADWANRGINMWTFEQGTITLEQGLNTYPIPVDTVDLLDHVIRTQANQQSNQADLTITRISVSTYATLPNKLQQARPIQVWYQRLDGQISPTAATFVSEDTAADTITLSTVVGLPAIGYVDIVTTGGAPVRVGGTRAVVARDPDGHLVEIIESPTVGAAIGLTAANLSAAPTVATHDADMPRVAIYSQWSQTQELGWYRFTFDKFGIPFDLIYKERVAQGNLKKDYDVIVMAMQNINRQTALAPKAARPQPYKKNDKYKFLGMYGETDDMSGGFGQAGVDAVGAFLDQGGTLLAVQGAVRFPIEFGWARSIDVETPQGMNAQKPLVNAEISNPDSQIFYGYGSTIIPVKFTQGAQVFRVGSADQAKIAAKYVGGDGAVLSGLGVGMDAVAGRAFVVDIPGANNGKGRVVLFANNPIYRWQNHGEFNMVFNALLNYNDIKAPEPKKETTTEGR